ncbi:MAG: TonB-dependent receptor [Ferruginibacter sp.]
MKRKNLKRKLSMLLCVFISFLLLSTQSIAQEAKKITGKIVSTSDAMPVVNATITVKGTKNAVTTNSSGEFTIFAATGETLVVSSVGFNAKSFKVSNSTTTLSVSLSEDYGKMDEVVVIGYGKMKKTDLSSSQVTVTSADIAKTVNTSFDQALQGRAANVNVVSNSGQPGAAPTVMIRGINSLNFTNQPLYVVDGVQIKPGDPSGGANILSSINPSDIETMNVLQGPSATAIYGASGANGVIMVTTKRGKNGETKVAYDFLHTIQDKPNTVPVMNLREYAAFRNEYAKNGGAAAQPEFADPSVLGDGANWQDALFRRTNLDKHVVSLSGGTDKTTFYFSGEYFNQQGIATGSGFKRYSTRFNLENQTRKWLKLSTNIAVSQTKEIVNISNGGILNIAIQQNPGVPVKNPDGSWGGPTSTQYQFTNPVALSLVNDNRNKSLTFTGGLNADITFTKGLSLQLQGNSFYAYNNSYSFNPSYQFGGYKNTTTVSSRGSSNNYWWGFNQRLQYDTKLGKHAITAMVGHEATENASEGVNGSRNNFVTNNIQELSGGDALTATNSSSKGSSASEGYFGRLNYMFNDKYIFQASYRADASSNFGANNKWGYFPSVSAAWRISQEEFLKSIPSINELKLRVEYGVAGNSNAGGVYARLQAVPTIWGTGFLAVNFPNPDLQWETDKTANIGLDLRMFNNRVELIADVYQKNISNLLTTNVYPYYSGGDISWSPGYIQFPTTNVGDMQNKGVGITLNTVNIERPIVWKTGFNISIDRNKITKLNEGTPLITPFGTSALQSISAVGSTAALLTGYIAEGLFQNIDEIKNHAIQTSTATRVISPSQGTWVGDVKYKDMNGDGFINEKDRTVIGNPWAKFTYGFNNSFSYKNFDLNIFIYGSQGNQVYNYTRSINENSSGTGPYSNYFKSVSNFARPSNTDGALTTATLTNPGFQIARITTNGANGNNRPSQWYIEDGSYLRLKNVQLSYNLPNKYTSRIALSGLRVSASVQNLFTITGYKGYDPEVGSSPQYGTIMAGVDNGRYPSTRMYSINILANF